MLHTITSTDTTKGLPLCRSSDLDASGTLSLLNRQILTRVIHAQLTGQAALPYGLGLDNATYRDLLKALGCDELTELDVSWRKEDSAPACKRAAVYEELLSMRICERNDLVSILCEYRDASTENATLVAIIVATACLAPAHLWKSLGLESRAQLKTFLMENFPVLVMQNTENMRWKRFFYFMLCASDGAFVCKAPSCSECSSHAECFVSGDD